MMMQNRTIAETIEQLQRAIDQRKTIFVFSSCLEAETDFKSAICPKRWAQPSHAHFRFDLKNIVFE